MILGAGVLGVLAGRAVLPPTALELICYALLLGLLLRQAPLVNTFLALDRPRQVFLGGFLVAMLAGHLIDNSTRTYPVVAWSMFTQPVKGDPVFYDYTGTLADGRQVDLHFDRLFPSHPGRNIIVSMKRQAGSLERAEAGPARREKIARFESTLQALGRKYNATHPDNPVRTVHVWKCRLPLKEYGGPSSVRRTPFWTVEIPGGD